MWGRETRGINEGGRFKVGWDFKKIKKRGRVTFSTCKGTWTTQQLNTVRIVVQHQGVLDYSDLKMSEWLQRIMKYFPGSSVI